MGCNSRFFHIHPQGWDHWDLVERKKLSIKTCVEIAVGVVQVGLFREETSFG